MSGDRSRLAPVIQNLTLLIRSAAQHARDDPLLFAVQAARRAPVRLRRHLAHALTTGHRPRLRMAVAYFIGDRPDAAREVLEKVPTPRWRVTRALTDELTVQVAMPRDCASLLPLPRARAAWNTGDISGALHIAESAGTRAGASYARRIRSERATMLPGFELRAPAARRVAGGSGTRVAHILTNSVPHTTSGYALRSHAILQAQNQAGIGTLAVTRIGYPITVGKSRARAVDEVDGVTYHRVLASRLSSLPAGRLQQMVDLALPTLEPLAPTVVHTTTNYTNALVAQALARALDVPWVYEVRGQLEKTWLATRHPDLRSQARYSERYRLLRDMETEMMLAADHVVTIGQELRDDISERTGGQVPVTVIPNGVPASFLDERLAPAEARAHLGLPAEGLWVGSVSSLVDYEGFDLLIDAVQELRQDGRDVRLALVGDGVSRPSLIARALARGLDGYSQIPGKVAPHQAPVWHQALDIFVVPRRDLPVTRTVTPLKPVEAMALGRPVIASDIPALTEIIGDRGRTFRAGEPEALASAIADLMDEPSVRNHYGEVGRDFARTRTWEALGRSYRRLYEELGQST